QPRLPGIDDGKAQPPDAAAHEVHAQETGNQEVDIAGPAVPDQTVRDRNRIAPAVRALERVINEEPRGAALRTGIVVAVLDAAVRAGSNGQRDIPSTQSLPGGRVA